MSECFNNKNHRIIHNGAVFNQQSTYTMYTYLTSLRNEFDVIVENYERTSERFSLEESK